MKNLTFYLAIIPALLFQLIGVLFYFVIFRDESFSQYIYYGTKLLLVIWPLCWLGLAREFKVPFWRGDVGKSLKTGLISGIVLVLAVLLIYLLFTDYWNQFAPAIVSAAEDLGVLSYYIVFSLFISVIHSFLEEYYWRWFVLNGLMLKLKKNLAIIVGAIAFASHHFIVVLQFSNVWLSGLASLGIFGLAVFWSHQYLKTKSLSGSWLSHFFADIVIMSLGYLIIF